MTALDIIIAIPLLFFIIKGWKRGVINQIATLAGIIIGCRLAAHLAVATAGWLHIEGKGAVLAGFLIVFAAAVVGAYFLGKTVEGFIKLVKVDWLNHILGAIGGLAIGLCLLSVLLNFVLFIDTDHTLIPRETQQKSILYEPTYSIGTTLTSTIHHAIK